MKPRARLVSAALGTHLLVAAATAATVAAQTAVTPAANPRPWGRVSFFSSGFQSTDDDGRGTGFGEFTTSLTYRLTETERDGIEYGLDARFSAYTARQRPERTSIYEAFVGARFGEGRAIVRVGHLSVSELGSLGSLAGGLGEFRSRPPRPDAARIRAGVFAGLEPNVLDTGYANGVRKFGTYLAYDRSARRHALGYVLIRHGSITERSALSFTNILPVKRRLFFYQAAEYDVQAPAGRARRGLADFYGNARGLPGERLELQATYHRGRAVDARAIGNDQRQGRPGPASALSAFLYESIGGRATVEVVPRVRVYTAYARETNNRDADPSNRITIGGHAAGLGTLGIDVTVSESLLRRPQGSLHSRYVSLGHQFGRSLYASGDYSTSLSVVRFSRSDGFVVETRPHTTRLSGTASVILPRGLSLLAIVERTWGDDFRDVRVVSGLTYRIR
jgi:hypothetical protein